MSSVPSKILQLDSTGPGEALTLIVDEVRTGVPEYYGIFSGWQWESIKAKLLRAGFSPASVNVCLADRVPRPLHGVAVAMGERSLRALTDKKSIDKWHLSPLRVDEAVLIPTYDFGRAMRDYKLNLYIELAFLRAFEFYGGSSREGIAEERFLLNPGLEETLAVLDMLAEKEEISCDVETGYGQINTVGFAWSPSDAIAINTLPDRCGDQMYYELWCRIAKVLEGRSGKIFQNYIYDTSYFSAYGIRVENVIFDTMHAMKVLWPELDMNLGNVGRLYTRRQYWKDDGRVEGEEGKKKDWGAVRDWTKHYTYNCRDTTGTFEAARAQREDLKSRGLDLFYSNYIQRLTDPIREACAVGMPVALDAQRTLKQATEARVEELTTAFQRGADNCNPRSPAQIKKWLKDKGIILPKKHDKASGETKETTSANAIKKLRLKYPEMKELALLQEIKTLEKALSSYIDFEVRPDGRLPYSLNITGTETLRFAGHKDPWDRGFNIQTIPREGKAVSIKSMFHSPPGFSFLEVDLRQAESRFVAYDSADKTLIDMLESGADVHSHVGRAILRQMGRDPDAIPPDEFKSKWRQLGKKAGHGLNYGMKAGVFVETVFNELDMVITRKDAELITQAYFGLFPGIPRWHAWVRNELYTKRKLTAPSGWERYFYGRFDDSLKEALAWRPQHTIPWITNHLMLHLCGRRKSGELSFQLIAQVHDSLILLVPEGSLEVAARIALDHKAWHPPCDLLGGRMWIPTEAKAGTVMSELKELQL